ncbi:hypothetical protein TNCV_656011 [Trichonephila clavipes]|nr:hypothetical protein TNCV_656011 [Trichonephila clavipes]
MALAHQLIDGYYSRKRKECSASFQANKCVQDDMPLANVGNHIPKMASNYRRCRKYSRTLYDVMYPCALEHASHVFMANNHRSI